MNTLDSHIDNPSAEESNTDLNEAQQETLEPTESTDEANELQKLKLELEEQKDKYLRMYSEFENFRRRTAKEKLELSQIANKELMLALLPVVDDCLRAQKSIHEASDVQALKEGLELVFNKLFKTLESKGLKALEVIGKEFDSEVHEAITQIPAPSPELKGKVVDEVEKGYFLNDKLIRFAKVVTGA